jgi:ankyrin repeat protein
MSPALPSRPSLEWLKKTAKRTLADLRTGNPQAQLAAAQLRVARDHGFPSWRKLKAHVASLATKTPAQSEQDVAAFFQAVGRGQLEQVRQILDATPAIVNAVGSHPFWGGRPQALHVAVEGRRADMVALLLAAGADVSGANDEYDHWSPIMLAIDREQPDMMHELRRRGARIGLFEALMLADDSRVEELLRASVLPAEAPNRGSVLALARTAFAIDRLLALGAPADVKDRWGSTPIEVMSRLGPKGRPLVERMIRAGVTALPQEYARLGDLETLSRLCAQDPSMAQRDEVMMAAVDFGHEPIVRWLLAHGANVNARSSAQSKQTALHAAAWEGNLDMVKLLVAAGADLTTRDAEHDGTPLQWAKVSIEISNNLKCAEVVAYLESVGATP